MIFNDREILEHLPVDQVGMDGDGFRSVHAYVSGVDLGRIPESMERIPKSLALGMARRIPLTVYVQADNAWGQVVWIDQEYISLDFRAYGGFYMIYKRAALGLTRCV